MTSTDIEKAQPDDGPGTDVVPASDVAGGGDAGAPHTALLEPSDNSRREAVRTRILLPLLLPIVSAAAIAFYVINLSRALLAGGNTGSLVIASIIAVGILGGAALLSSQPNLSTGTLAMVVGGFLLLLMAMGLTSLGPSQPKSTPVAAGYKQPTGQPVGSVDVTAEATLKFNATNFTAPAGVVQINYILGGGNHTLVFSNPKFRGFQLAVGGSKTQDSGKVDLSPGTYEIYCTVPGHKAAGMDATITVS